MADLREQLAAWLPSARDSLNDLRQSAAFDHIGTVETVGDGVVAVTGLPHAAMDEVLMFDGGALGLVMQVAPGRLSAVLLSGGDEITAGSKVVGTGEILRVPVGESLLGRVVDSTGAPLDGGAPIDALRHDPIERPAPGIVDRELVTQPLATGVTVIDTMIPLGRGQRELIIGDRKTGKTAVAVDAIINQKSTDVICIYAAVSQKTSSVNEVINTVRAHGAMERCIFVVGAPDTPPGQQWITPYAACTMAEYFRDTGRDALLIIDDLSKHAVVYRQLSLLLRRPPGREAYPGDVFYLHARLLERAAKLNDRLGGGSLTALPIAETQAGNMSAYIPTNLISITDGQIYLEPKLFYEGQKPAVNVGMSVSRVGGRTQAPAMSGLADSLKLEYSQFLELEVFTRFGAIVDERTQHTIDHGQRIRAILTQPENQPITLAEQVALLLAVTGDKLDTVPLENVRRFKQNLRAGLEAKCPAAAKRIVETGALSDSDRQALVTAVDALLAEGS